MTMLCAISEVPQPLLFESESESYTEEEKKRDETDEDMAMVQASRSKMVFYREKNNEICEQAIVVDCNDEILFNFIKEKKAELQKNNVYFVPDTDIPKKLLDKTIFSNARANDSRGVVATIRETYLRYEKNAYDDWDAFVAKRKKFTWLFLKKAWIRFCEENQDYYREHQALLMVGSEAGDDDAVEARSQYVRRVELQNGLAKRIQLLEEEQFQKETVPEYYWDFRKMNGKRAGKVSAHKLLPIKSIHAKIKCYPAEAKIECWIPNRKASKAAGKSVKQLYRDREDGWKLSVGDGTLGCDKKGRVYYIRENGRIFYYDLTVEVDSPDFVAFHMDR